MRYRALRRLSWTALCVLVLACKPAPTAAPPPAAAPAAPKLASSLRAATWESEITPTIAEKFRQDFGVTVELEIIESNEDVIERLENGETWDVWTPSDYAVQIAVEKGLLHPLDRIRIPNARGVGRRFQNASFDPELKHSVPFKWGTAGLGYDKKFFPVPPTSWKVIFDPKQSLRLAGKISLLDDVRETMGIALISLGLDPNSTREADYAKARDLLLSIKKNLTKFDSLEYSENLAAHKLALTHGWSGDIGYVVEGDNTLGFSLPAEGYLLYIDNLAIPKASEKKETAELFINYLLRPDVSAQLVNETANASTIAAARAMITPKMLASPGFLMPEGIPFHVFKSLGPATEAMERYWQQVVAAP